MRIFLRMRHGYGDNAQFRTVVNHYRHLYPEAYIKIESLPGTHCFYKDLIDEWDEVTWPFRPEGYDIAPYIHWPRPDQKEKPQWERLKGLPHTKTTEFLLDNGLTPVPDLYGYEAITSEQTMIEAADWLDTITGPRGVACIHFQGSSQAEKKNIKESQAWCLALWLYQQGFGVWVLDFGECKFIDQKRVHCPRHLLGGPDSIERACALIANSTLMVGINSGPACFAATTHTPAYIISTQLHPALTFDPAPNLFHLLPNDCAKHIPHAGMRQALNYFHEHYSGEYYHGDWFNILREIIRDRHGQDIDPQAGVSV